jgi:hypothetical protein
MGQDRLGPVLLARHRATGRGVVLTVLKAEWACLPVYVARLARDAYAAMQVGHPNLVRLVELGMARGRVYFASEFVDGGTLARQVRQQGPLPPRDAVAHILQAARGLRFAHGQGLAHGDVRAEDLLVDRDGVTRVARLGLVKTPESVAAEEARAATGPIPVGDLRRADEAGVAVRADLQGLGRSLTYLLTGSSPDGDVSGATGSTLLARGVPANLVELVESFFDPRPGKGHADLAQAVAALERFLDGRTAGATVPREEQTRTLIDCVTSFRAAPAAKLRSRIVTRAVAAWALVVLLGLLAHQHRVAAGFLGLGLMTALAYFVVTGVTRRTEVFTKVRGLVLESRGDWLIGLAGLVLVVTALAVLHLHWAYLGFGIMGVILALALHFEVDRKVDAERRRAVEEARALVKALRLQGMDEETLREFVRTTAGDDWEEFFEAAFSSEAARAARAASDRGLRRLIRTRSVPWRDWLVSWVEARQEVRRQAREKALLQSIEERGLIVEGVNLVTARRRARRIAEAMVAVSSEIRAAARGGALRSPGEAPGHPSIAAAIRQAVEAPEHVLVEREHGRLAPERSRAWELLLGSRMRFLVGAILVAGCLLWVDQNGIVTGAQVKDVAARAIEHPDPVRALRDTKIEVRLPARTKPLQLSWLPRPIANLFQGWSAGVAGLILILSSLVPGARTGLFAVAGAAITLIGPIVAIPRIGPLDSQSASMALGIGVAVLGLFFRRSRIA